MKFISDIRAKVGPALSGTAEVSLQAIDRTCMKFNKASVEFLTKYPGIAMTLSPETTLRSVVSNHYKNMQSAGADSSAAEKIATGII
jgi:hypothetical protein